LQLSKLTPDDLDKLDRLEQQFVRAVKNEELSTELEVFIRAEFIKFIGGSIAKFNNPNLTTGANY
jgi:hypothetical protein